MMPAVVQGRQRVAFVAVAVFGALLDVVGVLVAVPVAAMIQIVVGEVTSAYRTQIAADKAARQPQPGGGTS